MRGAAYTKGVIILGNESAGALAILVGGILWGTSGTAQALLSPMVVSPMAVGAMRLGVARSDELQHFRRVAGTGKGEAERHADLVPQNKGFAKMLSGRLSRFQRPFQKAVHLLVGLFIGGVVGPVGHSGTVFLA